MRPTPRYNENHGRVLRVRYGKEWHFMRVGISAASLYPMETEKALCHLNDLGYTLFEIFFNAYCETKPDFCALLNSMRETRGFEIKSVHPFTSALESMLLFERYTRRFEEGLAFYKNYMEAARRIGAKILVLHGQRLGAGSLSDREYCDHYRTLYRLGQSLGVTVAQENVRLFRSASPEFIAVMRRELGDEWVVLFRPHYYIANHFDFSAYEGFVIDVSAWDNVNELYIAADALVTDYSSVMFDYAILRRPMALFVPDYESYRDDIRGFYFDLSEVPGPLCEKTLELVRALSDEGSYWERYGEKYDAWVARFCPKDDGHAAERVIERVWGRA